MRSAKKHLEMLKGAGYGDDECKGITKALIDAGKLDNDLASGEDKKDFGKGGTASAALAGFLEQGLSDELAQGAVAELIKGGKVTDDLNAGDAPDVSKLDDIAAELAKGGAVVDWDAINAADAAGDEEAADAAMYKGMRETMDAVPALRDAVAQVVDEQLKLSKGAHAKVVAQSGEIALLKGKIDTLTDAVEALSKGTDIKLPPRTPTGAKPAPSPLDESAADGGGSDGGDDLAKGRADAIESLRKRRNETTNQLVKSAISEGLSRIEGGEDYELVMDQIELQARSSR